MRVAAFALYVSMATATATYAQSQPSARQRALLIGSNHGLGTDEPLQYAEADALRVRDALVEVSGFALEDLTVLRAPTASSVRQALERLANEVTRETSLDRLIIYVSSHAGDGALHLEGTTLPMSELVEFMKRTPAVVGVLIVDACRSGSVTRLKGLKPATAAPTVIEATPLEGRVFISASGADEYAQESEVLKGSTFTHHLLTGLRGAADASRDGQVTLDEAYAWAWSRTIEATFASRGGVQRPNFSVDLRGQGQLVLSRPQQAKSRLVIEAREPGHWLVVAAQSGAVVADVDKPEGSVSLALAAGAYRVRLRTAREVLEREVLVPASGELVVKGSEFERAAFVRVASKGDAPDVRVVTSLSAGVSTGLVGGLGATPSGDVRVRREGWLGGPINQLAVSFGVRGVQSGGLSEFRQVEFELRAGAAHRFVWQAVSLGAGLEVGPLLVLQSNVPDVPPTRTSLGVVGAAVFELRVPLAGPFEATLDALAGGAVVKKPSGITVVPRLGANLGVAYAF